MWSMHMRWEHADVDVDRAGMLYNLDVICNLVDAGKRYKQLFFILSCNVIFFYIHISSIYI